MYIHQSNQLPLPTPEFEKWALGYAGIIGGNPKGELWFCGIEFGGIEEDKSFYDPLGASYQDVPCWNDKTKEIEQNGFPRLQYDIKAAKISCIYFGLPLSNYYDYFLERLYWHDGDTFRLNLYPLAFSKFNQAEWPSRLQTKTGFANKQQYKAWCTKKRFPCLLKLLSVHKPKILICTGASVADDFRQAFWLSEDNLIAGSHNLFGNKKLSAAYLDNQKETISILTPFLGPGGLMSDLELTLLGQYARKTAQFLST